MDMSTNINQGNDINSLNLLSKTQYGFQSGETFFTENFLKFLTIEDEKAAEEAGTALHELLNVREKNTLMKILHLTSATVIDVNDNGSCTLRPSGTVDVNPLNGKTFNNGVWSDINNVSIFQNIQPGDEVIVLSYGDKNKSNSVIIGVHRQKNIQKFINVTQRLKYLQEFYDSFINLQEQFNKYKIQTDEKIKQLTNKITSLEDKVNSLSSTT